mmetsp:Transcript_11686/g.32231  ORF Transcript_11686/g.32231 Transcript_11686/m.32231 type:complete len:228 (+) Transcript_11686:196-879(+)
MYISRSDTNASYNAGADFCSCPMIFFTFSFVLSTSTKLVNSERYSGSLGSPNALLFMFDAFNSAMLFSSSESGLIKAARSVCARPSVTRRNVTSTSRSPRIISAPMFCASCIVSTNSSPALRPAESSFLYMPLMPFPTAIVAARMRGLRPRCLGSVTMAGCSAGAARPSSPAAASAGCCANLVRLGMTMLDFLTVSSPESSSVLTRLARMPDLPMRLASSSTKTALG